MKNKSTGVKQKGLSAWQLTMMALGTVIDGSFFLGSSVAIEAAGPSILLSFILGGVLVYFILFALSEMTVSNPTVGSFRTYAVIVAKHIRFRKKNGCPEGKCKMRGFPYSSLIVLVSLIIVMLSMPLIPGQVYGFVAGIVMTALYIIAYLVTKSISKK